ncbi:hypothetical protein HYPSUDRAFT_907139 [Hypholoma sublateritium FD-334 SS-4]|uniref:Uncharacterized protein n=1 Tax=Hypholoma sublateritium (strain FD-334 SS-4) TaxID=945553 RepID=A0A0D2KX37_HYPSF|nr:hypothetical protein HYPSUDRAFT_907139 [Hypholoma sublateritium FD-334 SS-4]
MWLCHLPSARSVEIVKPRRKATIESSRKPSLYDEPTLTEPSRGCSIAEPESPLEGRRTKMGATSKAPDKHPDTVTALGIISMTDNTVPEAAEDLSVDVVAVRAIQSPATSSGSSSYFTAAMVLEYSLQEWTQSQNSSTSGIVREEAASMVPIHTPDSTRQNLLRIATVLQRAARQARDQEALSQASTFRAVSPLLLFVLVLVIGTLLPQQYSTLQERYGTQCGAMVSFLVIGGAGCALLLLRAMIWVAGVLGESFCQMDLNSALRQGECRDVDGTQMREADLLICSFLFG